MPNLKEVRNRISSVNSTQQITKAMKMVAASKLRRAQEGITQIRPYASKLDELIINLNQDSDQSVESVFSYYRDIKNVLLIVVTSDKGLCGAFNTNVIKGTVQLINENYKEVFEAGNLKLLCIGKKGFDFFSKRGYNVISEFSEIQNGLNFDKVREAAEYAMELFEYGEVDRIDLIYNEFKNVAVQILRKTQFLPLIDSYDENILVKTTNTNYIFEPSKAEIITELIPKSLKIKLYKAVLDSNASEQGARMTAMEKATDNAGELLKELKITYNRSRQAAITKEILEIVGGAEALKSGS